MTLSIVIPTLNEEKYLPRLLGSIKKQSFQPLEIIISDGNSEDKTRDIAQSFGAQVLVDDKRSPSHQRNIGADRAQGDLVFFMDADDFLLEKDFLEQVIGEFKSRRLAVAGFYIKFDSSDFWSRFFGSFYNLMAGLKQFYRPIAVGAGIIITRELHKEIKGFDENLPVTEDYDYVCRAGKKAKFGLIKSYQLNFSSRRLAQEGNLKVMAKWFRMGYYDFFGKKDALKRIKYEFGKYKK